MRALRILVLAGTLAVGLAGGFGVGGAAALPMSALAGTGVAAEPVQAFCGPYRCFARPFWRYRSGAGFFPYRRFGFAPLRPRFAPYGIRRFGGFGGGFRGGFGGGFRGGFGGRPGGFRRF